MSALLAATRHPPVAGTRSNPRASVRGALAGLSLSMLMPALDTSIVTAGLPALADGFGASFQATQWVVLASLLTTTTLVVGAGRLGDAIGRRRLLLAGLALFTVASLLCAVAPTLSMLLVCRAAQGLGGAIMMALAVAFVRDTVPETQTGRAMGLLGTMSAAGTTLGPSLGGLLVAGVGWRAIFLVNVPAGLLAGALAWRHLPPDPPPPEAPRPAFDRGGAAVLAVTLAAYALAMTRGRGHFGAQSILLLATAAGGFGVFAYIEGRVGAPLIHLALFRERALSAALAMSALVSTVIMTTLVVGPFYLTGALGLAPARAGLALSAGPLVAALTGVAAGPLVDRHGAHRTTLLGLLGMTGSASLLFVMPAAFGVIGYLAPVGLMTAGYALFQTANNTAIMTATGEQHRGVTAGLLSLSRNLGLITGASAMGAVFAHAAGSDDITTATREAVVAGMQRTFGAAALLLVGALVLAMGSRVLERRRARAVGAL